MPLGRGASRVALVLLALLGGCAQATPPDTASAPPTGLCDGWVEYPGNPLIEPPPPEWLIADPAVLLPDNTPDARWHMFANSLFGIQHYASDNGIAWKKQQGAGPLFGGMRPWVIHDNDRYYMLYELLQGGIQSTIQWRSSDDLEHWSEPQTLLSPELPWETENNHTIGNPFLEKRDNGFALYYSASTTKQADTGFFEPLYLGVAYADTITGPYRKRTEPIMGRDPDNLWRNQGAGSIKLFPETRKGKRIAFNNWIYTDSQGHSRSAIHLLESSDGENWTEICPAPIVKPEDNGWKAAFVYAFDVKRVGNQLWMFYNARDGWADGSERIGLTTLSMPTSLDDAPLFSR